MDFMRLIALILFLFGGMIVGPGISQVLAQANQQIIMDRTVLRSDEPVKAAMLYHVLAEKETPIKKWAVRDPYLDGMADDFQFGKKILAREKINDLRRMKAAVVAGDDLSLRLRRSNLLWEDDRNDDDRIFARQLSQNNSFVVPHLDKKYLIHLNQDGISRELRFQRSDQYAFFNKMENDRADAFLNIQAVSGEPEPVEIDGTTYHKINARLVGMTIYSADNKVIIYQAGEDRPD